MKEGDILAESFTHRGEKYQIVERETLVRRLILIRESDGMWLGAAGTVDEAKKKLNRHRKVKTKLGKKEEGMLL